jgi:hypothetical protein
MKNEWDSKKCFGQQAEDVLHGEAPYKCLKCEIFDKCHKITVAACLQAISTDLSLITANGLATNKLMGFSQLSKLAEADMKKKNFKHCASISRVFLKNPSFLPRKFCILSLS